MKRVTYLSAICLSLFPVLLLAITAEKVVEKSYPLKANGLISLMTDEGSVSIRTWDQDEVRIVMTMKTWGRSDEEANRRLEDLKVDIKTSDQRIDIKERQIEKEKLNFFDIFESDFWNEQRWRSSVIDFEITTPRQINLTLACDEGDVQITGVEGVMKIRADEGNVVMDDVCIEELLVTCDEGNLRIKGMVEQSASADMKIFMDEGNISLDQCHVSKIQLRSDEGDIIIQNSQMLKMDAHTDEGDVDVALLPVSDGKYDISSDEGDLHITLAPSSDLAVRLKTDEGRISSDFDLSYVRLEEGERMEGTIGSPNAFLKAFTSEGDIRLIRQTR